MALPTYDKSKRKKTFQALPKGAYVIVIKGAKEENNKSGFGSHVTIAFDIAEGEYRNFYNKQYEANTNEDKKWPNDAVFYLNVPSDNSESYVWDNWNTFFADLEDSNNGFRFDGTVSKLKGKLIGGKFYIEQSESDDKVYDHTRLKWTCVAEDVRTGNYGKLPNDKLVKRSGTRPAESTSTEEGSEWMNVPDGADDEELPF